MKKRQLLLIILCLLAVYIIWGSTYIAMFFAIDTIPPLLMCGIRYLIAGIALYVFLLLRGQKNPSRQYWINSAIVGTFLLVGGTGFVAMAEKWVSSGIAAIAITTVPLWTCLFSGLFGKWPSKIEWLGLIIGFLGIVLLNTHSEFNAKNIGSLLLIIAPISWAFGSILAKKIKHAPGLMGTAIQMLSGGVITSTIGLLFGERILAAPSLSSLGALMYLAVFGSLIGFSAYMYLINNVSPALATSYAFVNPVIAVLLGVFIANESLQTQSLLAMILVISGVVLVIFGERSKY